MKKKIWASEMMIFCWKKNHGVTEDDGAHNKTNGLGQRFSISWMTEHALRSLWSGESESLVGSRIDDLVISGNTYTAYTCTCTYTYTYTYTVMSI